MNGCTSSKRQTTEAAGARARGTRAGRAYFTAVGTIPRRRVEARRSFAGSRTDRKASGMRRDRGAGSVAVLLHGLRGQMSVDCAGSAEARIPATHRRLAMAFRLPDRASMTRHTTGNTHAPGAPILRWILQRGTRTITCQLDARGNGAFEVCVLPHWDPSSTCIERFAASTSAFLWHAAVAKQLREHGWAVIDHNRTDTIRTAA